MLININRKYGYKTINNAARGSCVKITDEKTVIRVGTRKSLARFAFLFAPDN